MTVPNPQRVLPIRADARVLENVEEGPGQWRLSLLLPDWPGAAAGQFLMLSPGARGAVERSDPLLPRPMAVYRERADTDGRPVVEVLYKATGRGTRLIAETLPGQRLRVVGPLGRPFPPILAGQKVILVGGGTGTASLFELARSAHEEAVVDIVLGARSALELMGRGDFEALGHRLHTTTEDGSDGVRGFVTHALGPLLDAAGAKAVVYACGPTPMMRACHDEARKRGAACIVSLENNMACGFGVCLGCAVPVAAGGFALVCREGPVFDAADVEWSGLA